MNSLFLRVFSKGQALTLAIGLFLIPHITQAQSGPGNKLVFSGSANVSVPHAAALNAYPLTLTAWVQTSQGDPTFRGIVSKASPAPTNGYALTLRNGRVLAAYARSIASSVLNGTNALDGGYIADGAWHHVAFVVSASGGKLYVDGQLQDSHAWNGTAQACTPATSLLLARYDGNTLNCSLDDVALWNVARSQSEIQASMHLGLTGSESGLVGYWRLDDGSGTTATNSSSAGSIYSGTLNSSPGWGISTAPIGLPTANTLAASGISVSSATFNGSVLPNYQETTAWFQYGTTTSYGSNSSTLVVGASNSVAVPVAIGISGLSPATSYHYRLVAVNGAGTNYGNDVTFSTLPSSDASLSGLLLAPGTLSPVFNPATLSYSATVSNASVTVTPYAAEGHATIRVRINGGAFTIVPSGALTLGPGNNPIEVQVTAQNGVTVRTYTLTVNRPLTIWHVATNGLDSAAGTNWATAKQTIQAAIDVALIGDTVLVSNGVYATGWRVFLGSLSNRVVINKAITVKSLNGPAVTIIKGDYRMRGVYVGSNAVLSGLMITNGHTMTTMSSEDDILDSSGGGAWCETTAVLTNCVLRDNYVNFIGGGAYRGTLIDCVLAHNDAGIFGGGACGSWLYGCSISSNTAFFGGGTCTGVVFNCTLAGNRAAYDGGGAYSCVLSNCTLSANTAVTAYESRGGGAFASSLSSCSVSSNASFGYGGGVSDSALTNCTLSGNRAGTAGGGAYLGTLTRCTLTGNFVDPAGGANRSGGGAACSVINQCLIFSNNVGIFFQRGMYGGGTYRCTVNNSVLYGNNASEFGGGDFGSTLTNCTLIWNSAGVGGGASGATLRNCISYYNEASAAPNYHSSTLDYSCTTPAATGVGNITGDPGLATVWRLAAARRVSAVAVRPMLTTLISMAKRGRLLPRSAAMNPFSTRSRVRSAWWFSPLMPMWQLGSRRCSMRRSKAPPPPSFGIGATAHLPATNLSLRTRSQRPACTTSR